MGKSPPDPPDPRETSAASTGTNIGTAIANAYLQNPSEITPDGRTDVQRTGSYKWFDDYTGQSYDIPTFTRTTTLSPQQRAIKARTDTAQQNLATLARDQSAFLRDRLGRSFDLSLAPKVTRPGSIDLPSYNRFSDAPELATSYGSTDFSEDRQRVEDALMSRMQTRLDSDRESLDSRLAQQGVRLGSTAYTQAQSDFGQNVNDARMSAILGAGEEQARMVGMERDRAAFGNAASQQNFANRFQVTGANNQLSDQRFASAMSRQQAEQAARQSWMQERLAARNQPINEITALLSGSQVSMPQFMGANVGAIPTTDVAGLINKNYDQRLGVWQQQNAMTQNVLGGLFGLGSAFIMSDDDAKKDKERIIDLDDDGTGLWAFRYKGEPEGQPKHIGLMASEVEEVAPEAVKMGKDGYRRVDYGRAMGAIMGVH